LAGQLAIRRGAAVGRDHRGGLHVQIEVDGEVSDAQMIRMRVCRVLGGELVSLCQYL
jgi:preprotein translocase subunit SecD